MLAIALLAMIGLASAYVSMSTFPVTYTQDFDTLISSGSTLWINDSTLPSWYGQRTGANPTNFNIQADSGTTATNLLFSYGSSGSAERALGSRGGRNFAYGVLLRNTSGYTITDLSISYYGEQWRDSDAPAQTARFAYQTSTLPISDLTPNVLTGWTTFTALDFTSPQVTSYNGPLDGNDPANRVLISATIAGLNLPDGQYIMLKWDDPDYSGNDHDMGIDDLMIMWDFDQQVPVELSTFTATITSENFVNLTWISQSESNMAGYYVFRSDDSELANAQIISPLILATNSSSTQIYNFVDTELFSHGYYYYWLQSVELNGSDEYHGPVGAYYNAHNEYSAPEIPLVTELKAVYPNPFNPQVLIPYSLAQNLPVNIRIFNSRGQLQMTYDPGVQARGNYTVTWNGTDLDGQPASSGVYYIIMNTGQDTMTRKAVLLK